MILLERLELVEEGLEQRRHKDAEDEQGQRGQPDAEPVAAGPAADDPVEEQQDGGAEEQGEAEGLGLVAEPAAPALDADVVALFDVLAEPVERQTGEGGDDEEGGEEDEALNPAAGGDALRPGFEAGGAAGGEQQPENERCPRARRRCP